MLKLKGILLPLLRMEHSALNILVLTSDVIVSGRSKEMFSMMENELRTCLGFERYTIYSLPVSHVTTQPWGDNCALLVATSDSNLGAEGVAAVLTYVKHGGKCLCMNHQINMAIDYKGCSQRLETINNVVEVNYGTDKTFTAVLVPVSRDTSSQNHSAISWSGRTDITMSGTTDKGGSGNGSSSGVGQRQVCISVLGVAGGAQCVVSSVELLAPLFHTSDMATIARLKQTSETRHGFLREVFSSLGLLCGSPVEPQLTYLYLMCSSDKVSEYNA